MKKRIISLILASVMLLSMTSCGKKKSYAEMSLTEYEDTVRQPWHFSVSVDPSTVTERKTVAVYDSVEFLDFEESTLKELLLQNPITEENVAISGLSYTAQKDAQQESLTVYDGGEAYAKLDPSQIEENAEDIPPEEEVPPEEELLLEGEMQSGLNGGFSYSLNPNKAGIPAWKMGTADYPILYCFEMSSHMESDFFQGFYDNAGSDLAFQSRAEITKDTLSLLQKAGIPQLEVKEIVAFDLAALEGIKQSGVPRDVFTAENVFATVPVDKSAENYQVLCRQLINDIPINSYRLNGTPGSAELSVQYTQKGVVEVNASNLVEQPKGGTETKILSPAQAIEAVKDHYGLDRWLRAYTVEDLELVYLEQPNEDGKTVSLRPYWLVKTSYQQQFYTYDQTFQPLEGVLKAYDFNYIDAVSGDYFEGSTSGQPMQ